MSLCELNGCYAETRTMVRWQGAAERVWSRWEDQKMRARRCDRAMMTPPTLRRNYELFSCNEKGPNPVELRRVELWVEGHKKSVKLQMTFNSIFSLHHYDQHFSLYLVATSFISMKILHIAPLMPSTNDCLTLLDLKSNLNLAVD